MKGRAEPMLRKAFNDNWQQIAWWAGSAFFLFILIILFYPTKDDFLKVGPQDMKTVEIENSTVVGFKNGKRSYEVFARYVWSPRTTDRATLEDISDGKAYDNGRTVLKDLKARRVFANSEQEELVAQEGVKAVLVRKKKPKASAEEQVIIWAENLVYTGADKKTKVSGTIRVQQKEAKMFADKAEIDHNTDTVSFEDPFHILYKNLFLTALHMKTYLEEERLLLQGQARIVRKKQRITTENMDERDIVMKKQDLQINADLINFRYDNDKVRATLSGHIVVVQRGKKAFADVGFYDEQKDFVELRKGSVKTQAKSVSANNASASTAQNYSQSSSSGQAGLIMDKTEWLLDKETLDKLKNPKTRETFSKQTSILADVIRIRIEKKDAFCFGNVKVLQKGKLAYAERAYYLENEENIKLFTNVRFQQDDGTWLSADEALVSLKDNTFKAVGDVETNIILEK